MIAVCINMETSLDMATFELDELQALLTRKQTTDGATPNDDDQVDDGFSDDDRWGKLEAFESGTVGGNATALRLRNMDMAGITSKS